MSSFHSDRRLLPAVITLLTLCALIVSGGSGSAAPKKSPLHKPVSGKNRVRPGSLPPLTPTQVVPVPPTPQADDLLIYDGQSPAQSNLSVSFWGGGAVEDNSEVSFSKGHSLKITTLDPYQGAKITLQNPVDLGNITDPQRVLIFMMRLTADTRNLRTDRTLPPDNRPRFVLAQFPQGGPPGGYPAQTGQPGGAGAPGYNTAPQAAPLPPQTLSSVHLIFTRADGSQADVLRPYPDLSLSDAGAGAEQWVPISVPLAALHFPAGGANSPLQSIVVAGNDYAVFYLGQMRLTRDTAPISCFAGAGQTVPAGESVVLRGTADGGASSLKYAWDFDASDGIAEQATGPTVTTQFLKPKDYTVTLTVSDIDGLKKPATSTTIIHVQ